MSMETFDYYDFSEKDTHKDPVSTSARFIEFLRWRRSEDVDGTRRLVEQHPFESNASELAELFPCEFDVRVDAVDTTGTIPVVLHVGDWQTSHMTHLIQSKKVPLEAFLNHWVYLFESLHRKLYYESLKQKKLIYIDQICDLRGMSMRQLSPAFVSRVLMPWLDVAQSHYPETIKRISFLNPPVILSIAWSIVARMVSKSTVAKVKLFPGFRGTTNDFVLSHHKQ